MIFSPDSWCACCSAFCASSWERLCRTEGRYTNSVSVSHSAFWLKLSEQFRDETVHYRLVNVYYSDTKLILECVDTLHKVEPRPTEQRAFNKASGSVPKRGTAAFQPSGRRIKSSLTKKRKWLGDEPGVTKKCMLLLSVIIISASREVTRGTAQVSWTSLRELCPVDTGQPSHDGPASFIWRLESGAQP